MGIEISKSKAQGRISKMLMGCSINNITYYITGWELRFIGKSGPEYTVIASEITLPNITQWWSSVGGLPLNLSEANEPDDTMSAIAIFTVLNKWPVSRVDIDAEGNLSLGFENGCILCISALVEQVDWTWQVSIEKIVRFTCDSGPIFENV